MMVVADGRDGKIGASGDGEVLPECKEQACCVVSCPSAAFAMRPVAVEVPKEERRVTSAMCGCAGFGAPRTPGHGDLVSLLGCCLSDRSTLAWLSKFATAWLCARIARI